MNINKLSPHLVSLAHSILNPLILSLLFFTALHNSLSSNPLAFCCISVSCVHGPHTHTDPDFQSLSVASGLLWPLAIHSINTNTPLKNVPVAVLVAVVLS